MNIDLHLLAQELQRLAQYPALGVDVQEDHANLVISLGPGTYLVQAATVEQMDDLCIKWQSRYKED